MRALLAIVVAGSTGCLGNIDVGGMPPSSVPPADPTALAKWTNEAEPALHAATCFNCHTSPANGAWLAGQSDADIRASMLGYVPQVVDLVTPASSYVLAKNMHEGPALAADQAAAILDWIQAEHDAQAGSNAPPPIATPKIALSMCTSADFNDPACINIIPLDNLAPGVVGASVQLIVHSLGAGLYITHLYVDGGSTGVHLAHPLFIAYDPDASTPPIVDSTDRFAGITLDVAPSTGTCPSAGCVAIDVGSADFVDFQSSSEIAIAFKALSAPL